MKLVINNSVSQIEGLSIQQHRRLQKILSYDIDEASFHFSGGYGSRTRTLLAKDGSFPTGLLYLVEDWLKKTRQSVPTHDLRRTPRPLESIFTPSLGLTPYPEQIEAAKAALNAKHGRGVIVAPTGVGKSIVIALVIAEVKVNTLVVVPTVELERQMTEDLAKVYGQDMVGLDKPIYVENIAGLPGKVLTTKYDCLIIDEFHRSAAATYRELNQTQWKDIYYRFGTTATPFRAKDEEKLLLESVLSEVIYRIEYQTAVDKGYIVPMEAYYIEIPKRRCKARTWRTMYSELVVKNQQRNDIIANILKNLKKEKKSTLCLVKEIAHGKTLSNLAKVFFANGEDEVSPELIGYFNQGKIAVLVGTTGILSEGVNTKPCEYVIITQLGKSKNQFMQACGRAFRKYPGKETCKIILFLDRSHKWAMDHFKAQVKVLEEEYGVTPIELFVDL